ncbi:sulfatase-like hydrolase/transferase, partial [bacterium]|nr:sulfatase-like hydrolase/transferase [bacterium]
TPGSVTPGIASRYWHPAVIRNDKPVPTGPDDFGPDIYVDFLLDFMERNKDRPFLAYYSMCLPHMAIDFQKMKSHVYLDVPQRDPEGNKTGVRIPGNLKSNTEYIDYLVGRIVRHLEETGLRENTILLFTGDNGTAEYGKGHLEFERGPQVPLIVNGARTRALGPVDSLVDFSDILPTLCDLAGDRIPKDYPIDGKSFAPILQGNTSDERDWIFSFYANLRWLRDKRWLIDAKGRFFDCKRERWDDMKYLDVTDSQNPEVIAARGRFNQILKDLPAPSEADLERLDARQKRNKTQGDRPE